MQCMKPAYFSASCCKRPEGSRHGEGGLVNLYGSTWSLNVFYYYSEVFKHGNKNLIYLNGEVELTEVCFHRDWFVLSCSFHITINCDFPGYRPCSLWLVKTIQLMWLCRHCSPKSMLFTHPNSLICLIVLYNPYNIRHSSDWIQKKSWHTNTQKQPLEILDGSLNRPTGHRPRGPNYQGPRPSPAKCRPGRGSKDRTEQTIQKQPNK